MGLLVLKLVLTPVLIGAASLAGRRWGAMIGGWLIALPLTSGPVAFFVALDQGPRFAAAEATGSLLGVLAIAAFAVAYAWIAVRAAWPAAIVGATSAFLIVGLLAQGLLGVAVIFLLGIVAGGLVAAWVALPRLPDTRRRGIAPAWEIPGRIVVGTLIVLGLTAIAAALGPGPSGIIAIFPVFAAILTVFTQRRDGAAQGIAVLRGVLTGLFGTAVFFTILALGLPAWGVAAFVAALLGCAAIQLLVVTARWGWARQRAAASASMAAR